MNVADFDFALPESLIAQHARPRGESRLMIVNRTDQSWCEAQIRDLPQLLRPDDLLVVNDTRVFPARLIGRRDPSGGAAECLLLERVDDRRWHALVHPGQKLKPGARLIFDDPARAPGVVMHATVLEQPFLARWGRRLVELHTSGTSSIDAAPGGSAIDAAIDALGHIPLPPYIRRPDTEDDRDRYQTVYARARGSVAAPTAGLHFDDALLAAIDARGVRRTSLTLHVGYGTFKPVRVDRVEDHVVDPEAYDISPDAAAAIAATRSAGGRIVAVGTTTTRALESAAAAAAGGAAAGGPVAAGAGVATLFLHPGHTFTAVDALVTNFHLPKSSLLMLVAAFGGRELVLAAYHDAVARGFRFYSYGDAMVVI
jgi:S-adenosylmethionine:tRNA ribosyltransferase-isomerase